MAQQPENLIWLDMEMSGLDIYQNLILEVAVVATDAYLHLLDEPISYVIHQPQHLLTNMDPWNVTHHGASGLLAEVEVSTNDVKTVEQLILNYIKRFVPQKTAPLCGNTIGQDRRFLYRDMPHVSDYLHYRNIDVTSFKEIAKRWRPNLSPFKSKGSTKHRAKDDILGSIEEMRYYQKHLIVTQGVT